MQWIAPGWEKSIQENVAAYKHLKTQHPGLLGSVYLQEPIRYAALWAKVGSWLAILMEVAAGIAMFFRSNYRFSHLLLLATITGVFFFRLETGFLAILCCMALLLAPSKSWRNTWLFCFILFGAMVATGAGLR